MGATCVLCTHETEVHDARGWEVDCAACLADDDEGPCTERARPGRCKHVQVTDQMLLDREEAIFRSWGGDPLACPDCKEYLYPKDEGGALLVRDEPWGAGDDPFGRPTDKSFWME